MTPQFLREEAARFRGMADTVEREASKQRFLMMATDFEARAKAADGATVPNPGDENPGNVDPGNVAQDNVVPGNVAPDHVIAGNVVPGNVIKVRAGRKIAKELDGA
jgi:hypothetical protein